jgi:hypothetical protein
MEVGDQLQVSVDLLSELDLSWLEKDQFEGRAGRESEEGFGRAAVLTGF